MDLQVIDLYDPTPRHAVGLAYLTKRHRGLAAQEFAAICQTTMQDLQSDPEQSKRNRPRKRTARRK
jgi:hypothetical protein